MIKGTLEKLAILIDEVNAKEVTLEQAYVYLQDIHADLFLATDGGECEIVLKGDEDASKKMQ